ncbi:uncharacterized protein [Chironomus tepperi]|uniref:uncharacterized protein n=1 Tax=Chironomus tepperi TaxID=113505 RepID=UPI00391FC7F5
MRLMTFLIVLACIMQIKAKGAQLTCKVKTLIFLDVQHVQSCYVVDIPDIVDEDVVIDSFKVDVNNDFYNYSCAQNGYGLVAEDKTIHYMPSGLETCFTELKELTIKKSKLRRISPKNLQPFSSLEYLDLSGNELEILESNLFLHNPNLKELNLGYNRIAVVESNGLVGLSNLKKLDFSYNTCYTQPHNVHSTKTSIRDIKDSCSIGRIQNNLIKKCESDQEQLMAAVIDKLNAAGDDTVYKIANNLNTQSPLLNETSTKFQESNMMCNRDYMLYILIASHIIFIIIFIITMICVCCCRQQSNDSKSTDNHEMSKMHPVIRPESHLNAKSQSCIEDVTVDNQGTQEGFYDFISNNDELYMEYPLPKGSEQHDDADDSVIYSEVRK